MTKLIIGSVLIALTPAKLAVDAAYIATGVAHALLGDLIALYERGGDLL
jgi:hypothetical protein